MEGYSGDNCQTHCTELSPTGEKKREIFIKNHWNLTLQIVFQNSFHQRFFFQTFRLLQSWWWLSSGPVMQRPYKSLLKKNSNETIESPFASNFSSHRKWFRVRLDSRGVQCCWGFGRDLRRAGGWMRRSKSSNVKISIDHQKAQNFINEQNISLQDDFVI